MQEHKYYQTAYRAYANMSFSPDKRAESECKFYDEICAEFADKQWAIEKFTKLFEKSLSAKSRCASSMITGPARFPVARMQKYNDWEHKATGEMFAFIEKVRTPKVERTELDYGIRAATYEICGVKVLHNTDENRLQLFHEGKPDAETITTLKKNGYKYSPKNKAWQRQLTNNAIWSLLRVFPEKKPDNQSPKTI